MSTQEHDDTEHPQRRRAAFLVALSVLAAFVTRAVFTHRRLLTQGDVTRALIPARRGRKVTAKTIAEDLHAAGLQGEELFAAMWDWHDRTGIETRDMYTEYQALQRPNRQAP